MARIQWDKAGEKRFEHGLDRGVFYPSNRRPGVPWNGLVSVSLTKENGTLTAVYQDGVKMGVISTPGDLAANISAFTYPDELDAHLGLETVAQGFLVDDQPPQAFHIAYRTSVGNDTEGSGTSYKIHLVYNLYYSTSSESSGTEVETLSPELFTWDLKATPEEIVGKRPTAHAILDKEIFSAGYMGIFEEVLYGTSSTAPRIPLPSEFNDIILKNRFIIVRSKASMNNLPKSAEVGDIILETSTCWVYSWGSPSPYVRKVFVIDSPDMQLLPSNAYPGDLVYVPNENMIYRIKE